MICESGKSQRGHQFEFFSRRFQPSLDWHHPMLAFVDVKWSIVYYVILIILSSATACDMFQSFCSSEIKKSCVMSFNNDHAASNKVKLTSPPLNSSYWQCSGWMRNATFLMRLWHLVVACWWSPTKWCIPKAALGHFFFSHSLLSGLWQGKLSPTTFYYFLHHRQWNIVQLWNLRERCSDIGYHHQHYLECSFAMQQTVVLSQKLSMKVSNENIDIPFWIYHFES